MTTAEIIATKDVTLPALFEAYLAKLTRKNRKNTTIYSNRRAFVAFTAWLEAEGIDSCEVTGDDMARYMQASPYAYGTKRAHAVRLQAAYAFGLRRKMVEIDPFDEDEGYEVPTEQLPDIEDKIIPASDLRSMRHTAAARLNPNAILLFCLLTYTGLRRNEIRTLEWADIDWSDERIKLRAVNAKGGKPRVVPIHPELLTVLKERNPDRRMRGCILTPTYSYVERGLNGEKTVNVVGGRGMKKPGEPYAEGTAFDTLKNTFADDYGFHSFRKTWMNALYRAQVQDAVIKTMGGWAKRGTMESYYLGVTLDQMREGILRLYEDDPV
jgi:integrase